MSVCIIHKMTSRVILSVFAVLLFHLSDAMNIGCESSPKPDFRAPGRRISEEKCREYDWERKNYGECSRGAATNVYPYLGLIGFRRADVEDYQFSCLATLISPNFALTVAHCIDLPEIVKARIPDPEIVRFGISAEEPAIDAKILKTITHPDYKPPSKGYDIGLLELAEELLLSRFVLPACLWSQPILEVEQVFVPGRSNDLVALTEMPVTLLDRETCESRLAPLIKKDWQGLKEHQLCGDELLVEGRMCRGSDGAPMINLVELDGSEDQMPYVLGISSFGSLRCEGLSIYTRVHSFLDWIEETVWSEKLL